MSALKAEFILIETKHIEIIKMEMPKMVNGANAMNNKAH